MTEVTLVIKLFQQFTGTDVKELAVIEALEHTTTTSVPVVCYCHSKMEN